MELKAGRLKRVNPVAAEITLVCVAMVGASVAVLLVLYSVGRGAASDSGAADLAASISIDNDDLAALMNGVSGAGGADGSHSGSLAIDGYRLLIKAGDEATQLDSSESTPATAQLATLLARSTSDFQAYAASTSDDDRRAVVADIAEQNRLVDEIRAKMSANARDAWRTHDTTAKLALVLVPIIGLIGGLLVGATAWIVERRLRRARILAEDEQAKLQSVTAGARRRNEQFQALYEVVSEVTETLSMKYVCQTTVREARSLVAADVAVLRVLRDSVLITEGADQEQPSFEVFADVELGRGLAGRAAKRGKSFRLANGAGTKACDEEDMRRAQSALVIPLIVGARVVGTLTCWSETENRFGADDELVLEMMASQVATALVAAGEQEESNFAAEHDSLTGLSNRRQLARDTRSRWEPLISTNQPVSFAMLDVDFFKQFNDSFGHRAGDIALQQVAEVLGRATRPEDSIYRYGGEEFLLIMPAVGVQQARGIVERLRQAVEAHEPSGELAGLGASLRISAGVASSDGTLATTTSELIKQADAALYTAKRRGRNRVEAADAVTATAAAA